MTHSSHPETTWSPTCPACNPGGMIPSPMPPVAPHDSAMVVESLQRFLSSTWMAGLYHGRTPVAVHSPLIVAADKGVVAVSDTGTVIAPFFGNVRLLDDAVHPSWGMALAAAKRWVEINRP